MDPQKALSGAIQAQRNFALDKWAEIAAQLAVKTQELDEANKRINELEALVPAPEEDVGGA